MIPPLKYGCRNRGFEPRSGHPSRPQPGEPCGVEDKPKDWVLELTFVESFWLILYSFGVAFLWGILRFWNENGVKICYICTCRREMKRMKKMMVEEVTLAHQEVWMEGKLSTPSRTNASYIYNTHTHTFIYFYKQNLVVNDATKLKKQDFRSS